ncbi:unnamed protein product [Sphagnum balticum]
MPSVDHNIGICRMVRYYSSWMESEMVAEIQEPNELTEVKREVKPSILAYIGKEKRNIRRCEARHLRTHVAEDGAEQFLCEAVPRARPGQQVISATWYVYYMEVKPLRKSASMIVLRERQGQVEYLMMTRKSTMSFANSCVFPGGVCEKED